MIKFGSEAVWNVVDAFCMKCAYLHPESDDPCFGCKVREMMDEYYGQKNKPEGQ